MKWKGFGRNRSYFNIKVLSWHSTGGTEKNHENLSVRVNEWKINIKVSNFRITEYIK
jgi:hypothetical protein